MTPLVSDPFLDLQLGNCYRTRFVNIRQQSPALEPILRHINHGEKEHPKSHDFDPVDDAPEEVV